MVKHTFIQYSQAKPFTRSLISAFIGFFVYGAWSSFVHLEYGALVAAKAFITQGMISFVVTLSLTHLMEVLFYSIESKRLAFFSSAIGASIAVIMFSFTVNYLIATPEILMSIAPGAITSAIYSFSYAKFLSGLR